MKKTRIKKFLEENRWLKWMPNFLTICNSLCGFAAIVYSLRAYENENGAEQILAISAWIILFAMVFDALDGFAARLFNAASMHGLQMDSLADMVTFGVAPATIVAVMAHKLRESLPPSQYIIIWLFCGLYLGCVALRLATYNVHAILEKKSGEKFSGLPSPGGAAAISVMVIFYGEQPGENKIILDFLPYYAAVLGVLMVSNIPFEHMGKWFLSVRRNRKRLFVAFVALISVCFNPELTLLVLVTGYVLSGPMLLVARRIGLIKGTVDLPAMVEQEDAN